MNINDLVKELDSLTLNEQSLDERISKLEAERMEKEQAQLRPEGQEPAPLAKSEEQVKLEQERQVLLINKNKLINTITGFRQLQVQAAESEYAGKNINDFVNIKNRFENRIKELSEKINQLESERAIKEQAQLRLVGQEPTPLAKSEEQVKLEQEKLSVTMEFQKIANMINLYIRIKSEIERLKDEKDMNVYLTEFSNLIYKANKGGLPKQLIVELMGGKIEEKAEIKKEEKTSQDTPETPVEEKKDESKKDNKSKEFNIEKEMEIVKELGNLAKKLKEAMDNGDNELIPIIRGERQRLLEELNRIRKEKVDEKKVKRVEEIKDLLSKSATRLKEAMDKGDDNAIADERSYRQTLLAELSKLEEEINQKVEVGISKDSFIVKPATKKDDDSSDSSNQGKEDSEDKKTDFKLKDEEETNDQPSEGDSNKGEEEPEEEKEKDEKEYSYEEIMNMISLLERKKQEIDNKIVKVDLNAPWANTYELMTAYIDVSRRINELRLKLDLNKDEVAEKTAEPTAPSEPTEITVDDVEFKKKRKIKPRKFFKGILPKMRYAFYSLRKKFSKNNSEYESDEEDTEEEILDNGEITYDDVEISKSRSR